MRWWDAAVSSFWFLPLLIIAVAVGVALGVVQVDRRVEFEFVERWPLIFATGPAGARAVLSAVATSMITVAGVVFSITLVALSLTASQYSSRVLRNFMRSRINQSVLGVFVAIFVYCVIVLRAVRDVSEGASFVPTVGVLVGVLLGVVGILLLVFFIHHIATAIQASSILATVYAETKHVADEIFDREGAIDPEPQDMVAPRGPGGVEVRAGSTGYLQRVDVDGLLRFAADKDLFISVHVRNGAFVRKGDVLAEAHGPEVEDAPVARLRTAFAIGATRQLSQDPSFGIRQMVDVALRALSPGFNDATTAVMAIDYLTALMQDLADRPLRHEARDAEGRRRVIVATPSYGELVAEAFDQIRDCASGRATVLRRLQHAAELLDDVVEHPGRRRAIRQLDQSVDWTVRGSVANPTDRARPIAAGA
jgi:uncharacterized membrane protein